MDSPSSPPRSKTTSTRKAPPPPPSTPHAGVRKKIEIIESRERANTLRKSQSVQSHPVSPPPVPLPIGHSKQSASTVLGRKQPPLPPPGPKVPQKGKKIQGSNNNKNAFQIASPSLDAWYKLKSTGDSPVLYQNRTTGDIVQQPPPNICRARRYD